MEKAMEKIHFAQEYNKMNHAGIKPAILIDHKSNALANSPPHSLLSMEVGHKTFICLKKRKSYYTDCCNLSWLTWGGLSDET